MADVELVQSHHCSNGCLLHCPPVLLQVERWQFSSDAESTSSSRKRPRDSTDSRHELQLTATVDSPEEQAAAEAVLATLYLTNEPLAQLGMEQLVQAVLIADRLRIMTAAQQAADLLITAVRKHDGFPLAAVKLLCQHGTLPSCLLRVLPALVTAWQQDRQARRDAEQTAAVELLLVAVLGRLNDVWADEQLYQQLLQLPLPGIELLLKSDQLEVDSEDTVLYTAVQYAKAHRGSSRISEEAIAATAAAAIRCPQLSNCCLSAVALAVEDGHPLKHYKDQLQQLLVLRFLSTNNNIIGRVKKTLSGPPAAWLLPQRVCREVLSVSVTWHVNVEKIFKLCKLCYNNREEQDLLGPSTPPKAGFGWKPTLIASPAAPDEAEGGCWLGLYVAPDTPTTNAVFKYQFELEVHYRDSDGKQQRLHLQRCSDEVMQGELSGWQDVLELGAMRGGLDKKAWTRKLLPKSGELKFRLSITRVWGDDPPADTSPVSSSRLDSGSQSDSGSDSG